MQPPVMASEAKQSISQFASAYGLAMTGGCFSPAGFAMTKVCLGLRPRNDGHSP